MKQVRQKLKSLVRKKEQIKEKLSNKDNISQHNYLLAGPFGRAV
jgi:hypothetical protein